MMLRVVRDANGDPTGLGLPYGCEGGSSLNVAVPWAYDVEPPVGGYLRVDGNLDPTRSSYQHSIGPLSIHMIDEGDADYHFVFDAFDWFGDKLAAVPVVSVLPPLWPGLRFFPNGISRTVKLDPGEVAVWNSTDCSGPAYISRRLDLPYLFTGLGPMRSIRLGPHTNAVVFAYDLQDLPDTGPSMRLVQSECQQLPKFPPYDDESYPGSLRIEMETVDLVVSGAGCAGCDLSWLDFSATSPLLPSGACLPGGSFAGSNFTGSVLTRCDLHGADLSHTVLASANLVGANLANADLSSASFQGSELAPTGAMLDGAYLRGAKLDGANLTGASLANASMAGATVTGATLNSANFSNAFLACADFSSGGSTTSANGANFSNAVLIGAKFSGATLGYDPVYGKAADFSYALLQGADFASARVSSANFNGAYLDLNGNSQGANFYVAIPDTATSFPGFAIKVTGQCVVAASSDVASSSWNRVALVTTSQPTTPPLTDASTTCPDGARPAGGCTAANWQPQPALPPSARLVTHSFGLQGNGCSF